MQGGRVFPMASIALLLLLLGLTGVSSQGLMGGFKGHHRGTGAVELLLATGILAKLLNHRAKYGPYMGRSMIHALMGGARYPPRYSQHGRFPMDLSGNPSLMQDDMLEQHASMSLPFTDELLLNQESALLASKSPLLMSPSGLPGGLPVVSDGLLAEAQISQQLMAARRARKLLEARKILAAQEAKNILAVQREAAQLMAAQEAVQQGTLLSPSRQILTSAHAPRMMNKPVNQGVPQGHQGEMMNGMMGAERRMAPERRIIAIPANLDEKEAAQILANLKL